MLADGSGVIEARFLDALNTDDDDTARNVYADWLEEQGEDARAEYLRLQLELMAIGDPADLGARARELQLRAMALDSSWCALVHHRGLDERFANTKIAAWLGYGLHDPRKPFELPIQLRYLENLTAASAPPLVMQPLRRR